jgi:integrase
MLFTKPEKKQRHHEALPYTDLPRFLTELRKRNITISRALEFLILTAARSKEIRNMKWAHVDVNKRLWVVPAEDMKARLVHTVPLSDAAMTLLAGLEGPHDPDDYVFPGRDNKRFNETGLADTLAVFNVGEATPHGFRSTFSTWANEETDFDEATVEHSLAHSVGTKVAQFYARGEKLQKRKLLMQAWADYADGTAEGANVVKLHG